MTESDDASDWPATTAVAPMLDLGGFDRSVARMSRDHGVTDASWLALVEGFLANRGVHVIGCGGGPRMAMLRMSGGTADWLAERFPQAPCQPNAPLPSAVAAALRGEGVVRLALSGSPRALYVSRGAVERRAPVRFLVCLREETARATDLKLVLWERFGITAREFELVQRLRDGCCNRTIATELRLSLSTVRTYLSHVYEKLDVHSRLQLVALLSSL